MSTIEPLNEDEIAEETPSIGEVRLLRVELQARCNAAKLPIEDFEGYEDGQVAARIGLPCGRETRWIYCHDYDDYRRLLDLQFEQYTFLSGLDAICNYGTGDVEASVKTLAGVSSSRLLYSRVFGIPLDEQADLGPTASIKLESPAGDSKTVVVLGAPSTELVVLSGAGSRPRLSIRLSRGTLKQHDQAVELLRRTTDALFFQIDLLSDTPLTLARDRRSIFRRRPKRRSDTAASFEFPTHEYDSAPISLYWYARSAVGMPLLQFLAFYQVIEFYYPTYSQAEARRKIKSVLKDPAFRGDRDADLGRLLSAIQITRSGGFGDERSQLRATLMECVDQEDLRQFLVADTERMEFLSSKTKGLSDHRLPIATLTADLRADVAERIYEIRCKIVHTKSDSRTGELDLLLPFSKEAEQLSFDIDLAQYVAQRVLISASTAFKH